MFGTGDNETAPLLNDLFEYDTMTSTWTNLSALASGSAPSPRHSMGFGHSGGVLYVFDGKTGTSYTLFACRPSLLCVGFFRFDGKRLVLPSGKRLRSTVRRSAHPILPNVTCSGAQVEAIPMTCMRTTSHLGRGRHCRCSAALRLRQGTPWASTFPWAREGCLSSGAVAGLLAMICISSAQRPLPGPHLLLEAERHHPAERAWALVDRRRGSLSLAASMVRPRLHLSCHLCTDFEVLVSLLLYTPVQIAF